MKKRSGMITEWLRQCFRKQKPERIRENVMAADCGMEVYRLFQECSTGVTGYRFYHGDSLVGTGHAQIVPDFPVMIQYGNLRLSSIFAADRTIFPGCCRDIVDEGNPTVVYGRITYLHPGQQELSLFWDTGTVTIDIRSNGEQHCFWRNGELIAQAHSVRIPRSDGWEQIASLKVNCPIPGELAVMLLSFPLLRFAL